MSRIQTMATKALAIVAATLLLCSCSKDIESTGPFPEDVQITDQAAGKPIPGLVFIVTRGEDTLKLPDVVVRAYPESFLPKLQQLFDEVEADCLGAANPERVNWPAFQDMFCMLLFKRLAEVGTPFVAPTDPDGKFLLAHPRGESFFVSAQHARKAGGFQLYSWLLRVELDKIPPAGLYLTNRNLLTHEGEGSSPSPLIWGPFRHRFESWKSTKLAGIYKRRAAERAERERIAAEERAAVQVKLMAKLKKMEGKPFVQSTASIQMLWCKPGTFMMGSPEGEEGRRKNETPHEVTLTQGFWLSKYEVTQAQWEKVMGANPSKFKGATLPVEGVFWHAAIKFCEKLTQMEKAAGHLPLEGWVYTLPTEAQWEYACRAGTTTAYSFGDTITPKQANYDVGQTTAVGVYPANAWGFHDMHGNVWEWCLDPYGDYPSGSASDPVGPSDGTGRVIRGGSWFLPTGFMRSAYREGLFRSRSLYLGFRLSLQTETAKAE
ncbi:MAG: formylglycine-generating enzyme family protein [Opitutae bacterium]|nr:formylglycine-generating enzyme family protein [Opitutae bacterium]